MAPIKIKHIVSFSSQDPKHPVENLLSEGCAHPWLSCRQDKSRQLKVELQLERACHIGYIDIGNSGSAFLQIDVGRSIWPLDKPFVTLLPTTTLMSPADSKTGKNHNGVRMFKEGDFLAEAAGEKWDRLRIICSQPYNKLDLFGLSFVRLRSPLNEEDQNRTSGAPDHQNEDSEDRVPTPQTSTPSPIREMLMKGAKENKTQSHVEEEKLKEKIQQALLRSSPWVRNTGTLSRTARMVLSAANSRKRSFPLTTPQSLGNSNNGEEEGETCQGETCQSPMSSGSCPDTSVSPPTPVQKERMKPSGRRRLRMQAARGRGRGRPPAQRRALTERSDNDRSPRTGVSPETQQECSSCPICGGYFRLDYLPTHASTCGEDALPHVVYLSSSDDSSSDDTSMDLIIPELTMSWVSCPLCSSRFPSTEIERHASTCGE
ncbi:protein XNDC1N [Rhinophrynus dorsalis]